MVAGLARDDALARGRALLRDAARIVVLTGAGVSAESGIPTFRGAGGLWKTFRAEELATPEAFARDPRLVWEWYGWRLARVGECRPNAAHHAIATLALARDGVRLVTQNVDGLHGEAAWSAARSLGVTPDAALPLELHGSIARGRCTRCGVRTPLARVDAGRLESLPHCDACGAMLRPDVVWFGESLDPAVLDDAGALCAASEACLVVGTSAVVWPAAGLAQVARRAGAFVIEVNPETTPLSSDADVVVRAPAAVAVPALVGA
jgi:NAD-dependent deacetylase